MSTVDIVILIIIGFAAYKGYQRGLFLSLISIVAFIVSVVLAFVLLDWGVDILGNWFDGINAILPYLAFLMIFINLGGNMVKKAMDLTLLGSVDNLAGAVLGALKWVFGASLIIWLVGTLGVEVPESWQEESWLYARIQPVAPWVLDGFSEYWPFLKSLFESLKERFQTPLK